MRRHMWLKCDRSLYPHQKRDRQRTSEVRQSAVMYCETNYASYVVYIYVSYFRGIIVRINSSYHFI